MPALTVKMLVEFDPPLVCHKWMPDSEEDAIVFNGNGLKLHISFDVNSAAWAGPVTREELARPTNVNLHRAHITVVCDISFELETHLQRKVGSEPVTVDNRAEAEYKNLGRLVHQAVAKRINRLVDYALSIFFQRTVLGASVSL